MVSYKTTQIKRLFELLNSRFVQNVKLFTLAIPVTDPTDAKAVKHPGPTGVTKSLRCSKDKPSILFEMLIDQNVDNLRLGKSVLLLCDYIVFKVFDLILMFFTDIIDKSSTFLDKCHSAHCSRHAWILLIQILTKVVKGRLCNVRHLLRLSPVQ